MSDLIPDDFAALIFDCDGTLANTAPLHYQSMAGALRNQGYSISREWYDARVGLSRQDLFRDYEACFKVSVDIAAASRRSQEIFAELAHQAKPIDRILAIARKHAGTVPMAVASGGDRDLVHATLAAIGARDLFDQVVTVSDVFQGKPAPDLFLEAAKRLRVRPAECLVFEDSDEGLEAARRASMKAVDVRMGNIAG